MYYAYVYINIFLECYPHVPIYCRLIDIMVFFALKQCVCKRAVLKGRCLKCPAAGFLFGRISIRINSPSLELWTSTVL